MVWCVSLLPAKKRISRISSLNRIGFFTHSFFFQLTVLVMDHPVSWLAKVHRQTKPSRRGPVGQSVVSVGHLGRLTAADGFALRLSACPSAILSTEPGGISPQYVARIAMVGSH